MQTVYALCAEYKVIFTILHVISVVVSMGAALMSDMLFSFYAHNKKLSHTETRTLTLLSRVVWLGLIGVVLSGVALFLSDVAKYMISVKFLVKMSIMIVLLLNGYVLHKYISKFMVKQGFLSAHGYQGKRRLAFVCGAISVTSWFSVLTLGVIESVPITYNLLMLLYVLVVLIAISVALIVERKTLN